MLAAPKKAYFLLGVDPAADAYNSAAALAALDQAQFVVALTAFKPTAPTVPSSPTAPSSLARADVLLPIAPFTETAGCFVNMEGRLQTVQAAVQPKGEARPAWKVLRVLGNLLSLGGFDYDNVESVRADALPTDIASALSNVPGNAPGVGVFGTHGVNAGVDRLGETLPYQLDPIARHSTTLQATAGANEVFAWLGSEVMTRLHLAEGDKVKLQQEKQSAVLTVRRDDRLAVDVVRVAASHPLMVALGGRLGSMSVEKV
jgi:NADH-quinone oxidoreductase subunit G